ncbi:MAG: hypothetical protein KA155_03955 [Alphaproteobacteria bacterium]|jgi:hypothetical protein|nr:hypothetical protein [Alphaproteobacteria bacterium]
MDKVDLTRVLNITPQMEEAAAPAQETVISSPVEDPVPTPLKYEPTPVPVGVFIFPVAKPTSEPV